MFAEKYKVDSRDYSLSFSIPHVGKFGVVTDFNILFWNQLTVLVLLQSVVNVALAAIVYKFIVQRKKATLEAYLLGYGVICPFLLYYPFVIVSVLDLQNLALKLAAAAGPSLLVFRCMEAMYGTVPAYATESMPKFIVYYASTVQFSFDTETEQPLRASTEEIRRKALRVLRLFLETSFLYSILIPHEYKIFPSRVDGSITDIFYWGNICNNYLLAVLTSCCLEIGSTVLGLTISLLTGISTMDLNFKPLSASSSPSDFWGQRWNRLTSSGLKRAVYKPMRIRGFSRPVAAFVTFFASGLLHEYILALMDPKLVFKLGSQAGFFLWNGVVLILEHFIKGNAIIQWIQKTAPAPLRTALVIMTVLPLGHLFCDVYIQMGFYTDLSLGFLRVDYMG